MSWKLVNAPRGDAHFFCLLLIEQLFFSTEDLLDVRPADKELAGDELAALSVSLDEMGLTTVLAHDLL